MGVADIGIVGLNEVLEKEQDVDVRMKLGFGACRLSLAVPKSAEYTSPGKVTKHLIQFLGRQYDIILSKIREI